MDKIPYQKTTKIIDSHVLGEEYGFDIPSHKFVMWADPANDAWVTLWEVAVLTDAQLKEMQEKDPDAYKQLNDRYLNAVSELIVDCDIAGADFSTPDKVHDTFNQPGVDARFYFIVISTYCMHLLAIRRGLVKRSRLASNVSISIEEPATSLPSS